MSTDDLERYLLQPGGGQGSAWRWGTVTATDPLAVRLDGDLQALNGSPTVIDSGLRYVGERVWVQIAGRRVLVAGSAQRHPAILTARYQGSLMGGGVKTISGATSPVVGWSKRFLSISSANSVGTTPAGFFEIVQPPSGTEIQSFSGGTVTATTAGVPLSTYGSLWYEVAPGQSQTSDPSRFRVAAYAGSDYVIPPGYVLVVQTNADSGAPTARWGDGSMTSAWKALALVNAWENYQNTPGGFPPAGYRIDGAGRVHLRGLVRYGTATHIANLGTGYRPGWVHLFATVTSGGHMRLDVQPDGVVKQVGTLTAGFQSLEGVSFDAEG